MEARAAAMSPPGRDGLSMVVMIVITMLSPKDFSPKNCPLWAE